MCVMMSSSLHSPNVAALLKIKILSWSQETGFPVCVRVWIGHRTFNLHKLPLTRKSGYLREKLKDRNEVELPPDFPGGADTFEMMALFIYGSSFFSSALVRPSNVAALRCAAEFLQMREDEYGGFDMYLNQVVLQSWKETLVVLRTCCCSQTPLLPWAEDVLIISRCIETVAFMACMEILDPERRRPLVLQQEAWPWSDIMVREMMSRDVWIEDVMALPFPFFKRVIASLRRQGMKDKYVSPIILLYAHKWVLNSDGEEHCSCDLLQGVIELVVPVRGSSSKIPVGFYLSLLARSIEVLGPRNEWVEKLRNEIASVLHLAQPRDLLLPHEEGGIELPVMERIFMDSQSSSSSTSTAVVAQLWDFYLYRIAAAAHLDLSCERFITLMQTLPNSSRHTHDHLYRAINAFFQSHSNLTQEEKALMCKHLDCQKLSSQVCIEVVRNEVMPLRLMVQALFVQQQQLSTTTQQAACTVDYSSAGTLSSSSSSRPLGLLLQHKDYYSPCCEISRQDYESTSFRIQNLEKQLVSLKRTLDLQLQQRKISHQKTKLVEENKNNNQVTSCIASLSFASQRKYANRILKILHRLTLFRRGRSKTNTAV